MANKGREKTYEELGKEKLERKLGPNPRIELPVREIVKEWEEGKTQKELGEKYGVSQTTIRIRIVEYYGKFGKKELERRPASKLKVELPIEEIIKGYEEGNTYKELAEKYGVTESTISRRIDQYKEENKLKGESFKVLKSSGIIIEYLRKGLTEEQIELIALEHKIIVPKKVMQKATKKLEQLKINKQKELNER